MSFPSWRAFVCWSVTILPLAALDAQPATPDAYAGRRAAALHALADRLLITPSRESFKTDDQAGFWQATDFQYLTGLGDMVGGVLVLDGRARSTTLFVPRPNPAVTRGRVTPGSESARRLAVDAVMPVDSLESWLRDRAGSATAVLVSPTDARGAVAAPPPMANTVSRWTTYLTALGFAAPVSSATPLVRPLRDIKDSGEVAILRRVGTMSGEAMLAGMRALRPGRRQREVEVAVVQSCVAAGERHSFWPWAMSGPRGVYTDLFNSFVDSDGHDRAMRDGDLVRVDVGCQADRYMGDVGRTAPANGRFDAGQREAWDLFIAAYRAGLGRVKGGARPVDIFETALADVRQRQPALRTALGKESAAILLSPQGTEAWQFHGVGLDDAEGAPDTLRAGMTVAYEIMFAVGGQGYYLEDMLLVRPSGYEMLTPGLPYTAAEIEAAMRTPTRQRNRQRAGAR